MIIIITGASHTGKTYLSQKLLEEINYPAISIDHIKMALIRSGYTDLTPDDDRKLTIYLWPIIREMIKTAIENNQNMIIEGCYIPFNFRDDFDSVYLNNIKLICLVFTKNYINNNFNNIKEYSSIIEKRIDDSYLTKEMLINENDYYINGFKKELIYCFDTEYQKTINEIISNIKNTRL